ncbi:hypothetical protein [Puia dinghuensis]|uniref:Type 1 periplasmic binding fold superfamily protein n=1 Tax=Puia dinghuensis TaxID=1792502 RepID=A0A8J2UHD4_9BACT|nr:hypothetical protein [Puia dinghuensis]GGB18413.1 hypothetical protein GCM10011511_47800 [Puia dinghuensis]
MYTKPILKLPLFLSAILFCCLMACSKSNNNNNSNNGSSSLKATVDGTSWQATYVYGVDSTSAHLIAMAGSDNNQTNTLLIAFPDTLGTGTYSMNIAAGIIMEYVVKVSSSSSTIYIADPAIGGSGTITITSYNKSAKQVQGTFSGVAKNVTNDGTSKTIASGSFSVTYH